MGEYSSITAALAVLVSSLTGVLATALPTSYATATALVTAAARSNHVPGAEAHAAYVRAGYSKPALRYLYSAAWIDSTSHPTACHGAQEPAVGAAKAIQGSPAFLAQLRATHLTVHQAATAIGRGLRDGCG